MAIISTFDRFLGSLLCSYMGYHFDGSHPARWPTPHSDQLYQTWVHQPLHAFQLVDNTCIPLLPWLLYHHDRSQLRHRQLTHYLDALPSNDPGLKSINLISTLYLLGDSLEWLMQCPFSTTQTAPQLRQYLEQKQSNYPAPLHTHVQQWLIATGPSHSLSSSSDASRTAQMYTAPLDSLKIALEHCLNYRENLALALATPSMSPLARTIVGCLLGAWGGLTVIPTPWISLLSSESKHAMKKLAKSIYRNWAGISSTNDTLGAMPLDL